MRIVVTGNIGAGKSTVAKEIAKRLKGYSFHSVDHVVANLYSQKEFKQMLLTHFGTWDKKSISDIVFKDPEKRLLLEKLARPFTFHPVALLLKNKEVKHVVEFPTFYEIAGWTPFSDFTIVVKCSEQAQLKRVMNRDGFSEEKIARIKAAQLSSKTKEALADFVIDNSGESPKELSQDVLAQIDKAVTLIKTRELKKRCIDFFNGSEQMWAEIEKAYCEPHRHYHTLEHLVSLFEQLDETKYKGYYKPAIEMAIWFHDIVYDTSPAKYPENEARSANKMVKLLNQHCFKPVAQPCNLALQTPMAAELIMSTKGHSIKDSDYLMGNELRKQAAQLFLDLDLSIFATTKSIEIFEYDSKIAAEFEPVLGHLEYENKRIEFLKSIRNQQIFQSDYFSRHESAAKRNINLLLMSRIGT